MVANTTHERSFMAPMDARVFDQLASQKQMVQGISQTASRTAMFSTIRDNSALQVALATCTLEMRVRFG